jgi:hypothetical protein
MHKMACSRHKSRNPSRLQKTTGGHWALLGRSVDKSLGMVMREAVPELFFIDSPVTCATPSNAS